MHPRRSPGERPCNIQQASVRTEFAGQASARHLPGERPYDIRQASIHRTQMTFCGSGSLSSHVSIFKNVQIAKTLRDGGGTCERPGGIRGSRRTSEWRQNPKRKCDFVTVLVCSRVPRGTPERPSDIRGFWGAFVSIFNFNMCPNSKNASRWHRNP